MTKARVFLFLNLAFLGGVALRSFTMPPLAFVLLFFLYSAFLWLVSLWQGSAEKVTFLSRLALMAVLLASAALGVIRLASYQQVRVYSFSDFQNRKVEIKGRIISPAQEFPQSQRLNIEVESVKLDGEEKQVKGEIIVSLKRYPTYGFGDALILRGIVKPLMRGDEFVSWYMSYPNVVAGDDLPRPFWVSIFDLREIFSQGLERSLPEPQSSLAKGLLLGEDSGLDKKYKDQFRIAGISHIVALSGYNITIVASAVMKILQIFSIGAVSAFWVSGLGIIFFTVLTGAQASTVRAAIMGVLVLVAQKEGRIYSMTNSLVFAGTIMTFQNPTVLRFDVGFQLSFLATVGLIFVAPKLESYFQWMTNAFKLREIIVVTLASQIMVLPLLISYFGSISTFGLLANILVLPIIPASMLVSFSSGVVGITSSDLGFFLGWSAQFFLKWIFFVAERVSFLPLSSFQVSMPRLLLISFVLIYYAALIFLLRGKRKYFTFLNAEA